jgi:hypothetical protein
VGGWGLDEPWRAARSDKRECSMPWDTLGSETASLSHTMWYSRTAGSYLFHSCTALALRFIARRVRNRGSSSIILMCWCL